VYGCTDLYTFHRSAVLWRTTGHFYGLIEIPGVGSGYNMNLPHVAALLVPLAPLSFAPAAAIVQACNLSGLVWLTWRLKLGAAATVALLLSPAWLAQVSLGQFGIALACLVTLAWLADREGRPIRAGVWFGLAIACKPFVLPVLAWWALSRSWAALTSAVVVSAVLVLGMATLGYDAYEEWQATVHLMPAHYAANVALWGALRRSALPSEWYQVVWAFSATVIVGVAVLRARRLPLDLAWLVLLLASILASPLGWTYYGLMLVGPLSALISQWRWQWWALWLPPGYGSPILSLGTCAWLVAWGSSLRPLDTARSTVSER
jgi:hypothetical protein